MEGNIVRWDLWEIRKSKAERVQWFLTKYFQFLNISEIERQCQIPRNSLSHKLRIGGKFSMKYLIALEPFVSELIKDINNMQNGK